MTESALQLETRSDNSSGGEDNSDSGGEAAHSQWTEWSRCSNSCDMGK